MPPALRFALCACALPGSEPEEEHSRKDECQVEGLRAEVALVEQRRAAEERHDDLPGAVYSDQIK